MDQVKVTDISLIRKTADEIKKIEHVDVVKYGEGMVEQLVSAFDILRTGAIIAVVALILVTAFLITNTIKIPLKFMIKMKENQVIMLYIKNMELVYILELKQKH